MATVTRFPTSNTAVSGTWSNTTNAYASNGSVASVTVAAKTTTVDREYGTFGFGSVIPAGSTINSVAVDVRHRVTTTAGVAFLENLIVRAGTSGAVNSNSGEPTSLTVDTYSNYARPGGGSWALTDLSDANFVTRIRARSGNDGTSVTYEWDYISVTVDYTEPDTTAPTVSTFSPADDATNVNPNSNIVLTFDESIQRGTGNIEIRAGSADGTLFESFNAATSDRITVSGSTFTLDPTSNLADSTTYFVVFPSGSVKDTAGNNYAGTSTYSFATGDYTAPTVSTFSPANESTGASISANVVLTFDETVERGTGTITLRTGSASGTIIESFNAATSDRISISGAVFTLDPTSSLVGDTLYFVVFPSGSVKDTSNNNWAGTSTYSFTTAPSDVVFPTSPTPGQTFTHQGRKWQWSGTAWERPLVSKLGDTMTGSLVIDSVVLSGTASGTTAGAIGYLTGALSYGTGSVQRTVVNTDEAQTLTNKTLTAPVLGGTVTGTYTLGGTPTFPSTVVLTTGAQTLTSKTINITDNTLTGVAPLASPTFTGVPAAPTAAAATNTTQIATTAHVFAERTNTATLTNKTLTSPTLTTPNINSAQVATVSGTAPLYLCRAWVNFDGTTADNLTGTYSQTGTTVTVTATAHGLITGNIVFLDFTTGTAVDGAYDVTVTGVNTFTVTQASRTTSGNVTLIRNTIRGSGNVSSVADNSAGNFTVNFATAMPDANYCFTANMADSSVAGIVGIRQLVSQTTTSLQVLWASTSGTPQDLTSVTYAIFR